MHATIRRYEGVDTTRMNEVVGKVNEKLVGVLSSFGLFETPEQADESKTLVTNWIADENFNSVIPNPPKITSGKVVAQNERVPALV